MPAVSFTKVEGLGNDFILLDRRGAEPDALAAEIERLRGAAPGLCDRRTGVGADGILVVGPGCGDAGAAMIVINFDGSRPEMCGNGLRCVAAFVTAQGPVDIATDAGTKRCEVSRLERGGPAEVLIDMGPARDLGPATPAAGEGRRFAGVSMGNPHAVHFVEPAEQPEALARRLGPGVELDPLYAPSKTNVEFARVHAGPWIELWVWERGVGITQACGTGACATVVAAADAGLVERGLPIPVELPGGRLTITAPVDPSEGALMRGPARLVFTGRVDPAG